MLCRTGAEWVGSEHHRGTAIAYYVGIDVSLKESSVCVVDSKGKIVREAKAAGGTETLCGLISERGLPVAGIGMEKRARCRNGCARAW